MRHALCAHRDKRELGYVDFGDYGVAFRSAFVLRACAVATQRVRPRAVSAEFAGTRKFW